MFQKRHQKVSVYIPESPLLDAMRNESKYLPENYSQHMAKARTHLEYFTTTRFWEKDVDYKFVEKEFVLLLTTGCHVVELVCSVGPLPEYLKKHQLWGNFEYHGYDVNECSTKLVQEHYPEGQFSVSDLQDELNHGVQNVDIVFEKGTIISSSYPYRVLENILKLRAKHIVLIYCPFLKSPVRKNNNYVSLINVTESNAYLISVMDRTYFHGMINKYGYKIDMWAERKENQMIINYGVYQLVDVLITREMEDINIATN